MVMPIPERKDFLKKVLRIVLNIDYIIIAMWPIKNCSSLSSRKIKRLLQQTLRIIQMLGGIAGVIVSLWLAWAPVQRVLQDMKDEVKDAQLHGTVLTKSQVATNLALIALFWLCMTSIITILPSWVWYIGALVLCEYRNLRAYPLIKRVNAATPLLTDTELIEMYVK